MGRSLAQQLDDLLTVHRYETTTEGQDGLSDFSLKRFTCINTCFRTGSKSCDPSCAVFSALLASFLFGYCLLAVPFLLPRMCLPRLWFGLATVSLFSFNGQLLMLSYIYELVPIRPWRHGGMTLIFLLLFATVFRNFASAFLGKPIYLRWLNTDSYVSEPGDFPCGKLYDLFVVVLSSVCRTTDAWMATSCFCLLRCGRKFSHCGVGGPPVLPLRFTLL